MCQSESCIKRSWEREILFDTTLLQHTNILFSQNSPVTRDQLRPQRGWCRGDLVACPRLRHRASETRWARLIMSPDQFLYLIDIQAFVLFVPIQVQETYNQKPVLTNPEHGRILLYGNLRRKATIQTRRVKIRILSFNIQFNHSRKLSDKCAWDISEFLFSTISWFCLFL